MTAYLHTSTSSEPGGIRFRNAWISGSGESVHAAIWFGDADITLWAPEDADALIAAATLAKAELIRLEAERTTPPMAPEPSAGCDGVHPDGVWLCTAIAGHEPLDHVCYDPDGEIVTRWPSVAAEGGGA